MSSIQSICGVILTTDNMEEMVAFYRDVLGLALEREEHGGLEVHYGVDLNHQVHFALHPPADFQLSEAGHAKAKVAFTVEDLSALVQKLGEAGHEAFIDVHDEGFGPVAAYKDPDGNVLELVQLQYSFQAKE